MNATLNVIYLKIDNYSTQPASDMFVCALISQQELSIFNVRNILLERLFLDL